MTFYVPAQLEINNLVCSIAWLTGAVDLDMNLPAGMTPYILDMSVDVYEDYQAVIRIAVVIAQQVRPKEEKI